MPDIQTMESSSEQKDQDGLEGELLDFFLFSIYIDVSFSSFLKEEKTVASSGSMSIHSEKHVAVPEYVIVTTPYSFTSVHDFSDNCFELFNLALILIYILISLEYLCLH